MLTLLISESNTNLKCLFKNLTTLLIDSSKSHTPNPSPKLSTRFFFSESIISKLVKKANNTVYKNYMLDKSNEVEVYNNLLLFLDSFNL